MSFSGKAVDTYIKTLRDLHSRWEFHLPLVEAQFQFRQRYYGLASAQLLEDLFLDGLTVFVQQFAPDLEFTKPPRGMKEYDYIFAGERISHKVSKAGAVEIAVLWDATKKLSSWSANDTIALETAFYAKKSIQATHAITSEEIKLLTVHHDEVFREGDQIVLVKWHNEDINIVKTWEAAKSGRIRDILEFKDVWQELAGKVPHLDPINEFELFVFRPKSQTRLENGDHLWISEWALRPGTYVFPPSMFINVKVKSNNKAQLIPKNIVTSRMIDCLKMGNFVPSTAWYSCFSSAEPPNLFLAQRQEFDARFKNIKLGYRVH